MKTVKQLCLGVAVAGVVAGAGSAFGCAVAAAEPADSAPASDSTQAPASRAAAKAADRGPGRAEAPARAGRAESARVAADRDDPDRPVRAADPDDDRRAAAPVPSAAAAEIDGPDAAVVDPAVTVPAPQAAPEPAQPAIRAEFVASAAPAVESLAVAAPTALAAPVPAPAAPLVPVSPLPLFPAAPAAPVAPPAPASAISVSASATTTRSRSASAVAAQITDPPPAHVLLIGTDGTKLSTILENPANVSFFELMENGVTGASSMVGYTTLSGPSWSSILTGVWDTKTGVINNIFNPAPYTTWPSVFSLLEYHDPAIATSVVADWDFINQIAEAGAYPVDTSVLIPQVPGDTLYIATDEDVAEATIGLINLTDPATSSFIFSYMTQVDAVGHVYGGASPEYAAAVNRIDTNIGAIMDAVNEWEAATGQDWTVLVVTDHGHQPQVGFGHGFQSPPETSTFVIADFAGDDANDGKQNLAYSTIDVTPTILGLFGAPQRSDFDGRPMQSDAQILASMVTPQDLKQSLNAAIDTFGYPDVVTDVALGVRTVFGAVPYFLDIFVQDITAQLQSVVDADIFLVSALAGVTEFLVGAIGNVLVSITQAIAQAVGWLTGAGRIAPTDPPLPPPPAGAIWLPEDAALLV